MSVKLNTPNVTGVDNVLIKCLECGTHKRVKPSVAKTAKFCSRDCKYAWQRKNSSGENNNAWKGGNVEVSCKQCGEVEQVIPARSKTYKFCSYKCRGDWRAENWVGENHPNYKGKWTHIKPHYSSRDHRKWVAEVKELQGSGCKVCGVEGKRMATHHILPICYFPELATVPENGVVLCNNHHGEAHRYIEDLLGVYLFDEIREVITNAMGRPGEESFGEKLVNSGDLPKRTILSQASKEEGATTIPDAGVGLNRSSPEAPATLQG